MEVSQVEKCIQEVLEEKFGCCFELMRGHRDLGFRSDDYRFTFPSGLSDTSSSSIALKQKINCWLDRDIDIIKPNAYLDYDEDGNIKPSSVIE
ncbi:hypothetical protein MZJ31_004509 [Vibrio parahaemolyticus]|nr:hypothetical protein [Vibrio parahaemolyticus]EHR6403367.1 hypothetical protein [Vibrio parahaemolyticus]EIU7880813.1 hypothetical protein [Vibrio parahaemolyticus]EJC7104927.1 hypothetical protein [Vibrio parahaemolyticus]EJC7109386.1 hypothetical protein [Vibrio parahaemolyticus]